MFLFNLALFAAAIGFILLILPWQPWRHSETLEPEPTSASTELADLTVLIPARNEADMIALTLAGVRGLKVVLVDDNSDDGTADIARQVADVKLNIINGAPLPPGWSGKLWALEQGLRQIDTGWTLLLDADIQLQAGMAAALLDKANRDGRQFVSIMARLRMASHWEKCLMPAFIYFFKLLYPFRLANSSNRHFAAAAGGCILVSTEVLRGIGGFAAIKGALIDDCTLAKVVKQAGHRIWVGQSHSVISLRPYDGLEPIWEMVARSAFTQLRYSAALLGVCTVLMTVIFLVPVAAMVSGGATGLAGLAAYLLLLASYWPTVRYYQVASGWALLLPIVAALYLAMTWTSALRYWRGDRSRWKNRVYSTD